MSFFLFVYGFDRRVGLSRLAVPTCGGEFRSGKNGIAYFDLFVVCVL